MPLCDAVFAGSATFNWQTLAAQTTSKRTQRVRSGRPPKHGWPTHALAAGFNQQGTWLPQDSAVGTAAVHDISSLMPSKLEETGKLNSRQYQCQCEPEDKLTALV